MTRGTENVDQTTEEGGPLMGKCFVVLQHPSGAPAPIRDVDADGEPDITATVFESFAAAERAMDEHTFAKAWGYEIYPWPGPAIRGR